MEIRFNVTGSKRKALVTAVSRIVGSEAVYQKAPTFAYMVNNFTIDKDGTLIYDNRTADATAVRELLSGLAEQGFVSADTFADVPTDGTSDRLSIDMPLAGLDALALANLEKLVASKAALIRKSIGTDTLDIVQENERLCFPWFSSVASPEQVHVYTQFVTALCNMAKKQKRIVAKEKTADSEKYAFRCFLLRLGFIGEEYAIARKLLLQNLHGSGAFKSGAKRSPVPNTNDEEVHYVE